MRRSRARSERTLYENETLLASGEPANLECIESTGKTVWTTVLPGTSVRDAAIGSGLVAHADKETQAVWELGPTFLLLADARDVTVLEIATGKLAKVTP